MASTSLDKRLTSEATVSKCSSSAGSTPSCIASTVACMAMSGVRSSWATSPVSRCSSLMSRSSEVAMSSKVSPSWPTSFSPLTPERAVRSPLRICLAVSVILFMGADMRREVK